MKASLHLLKPLLKQLVGIPHGWVKDAYARTPPDKRGVDYFKIHRFVSMPHLRSITVNVWLDYVMFNITTQSLHAFANV